MTDRITQALAVKKALNRADKRELVHENVTYCPHDGRIYHISWDLSECFQIHVSKNQVKLESKTLARDELTSKNRHYYGDLYTDGTKYILVVHTYEVCPNTDWL